MKYLSIINSVLKEFNYSANVVKLTDRNCIRVYFSDDVSFFTETLLSRLVSIKGLSFVAVNFDTRSVTFVY